MALSIDMPALVKALTNGRTVYNPSLVPIASRYYSDAHKAGYTKNLDEAKKLLAASGYKGETLKLQTNKRYDEMYKVAVATQSMLSKAGIKTELEVLEWATQLSNFREGKFQLMSFGYSARIDPAILYADVSGDKAKAPMAQWTNPQVEKALDSIGGVTDVAKRKAVFEQLHRQMIEDVPFLMMYNMPGLVVVSKNIAGFKSWPLRKPRFFNVTKN
jgi:peptide/nickel transport system substrate-binding protein